MNWELENLGSNPALALTTSLLGKLVLINGQDAEQASNPLWALVTSENESADKLLGAQRVVCVVSNYPRIYINAESKALLQVY